MPATREPNVPRRFDFFLIPRFSLLTFSSGLEPLRIANWLMGRELYCWRIVSCDGDPVRASNGIPIPADASIADVGSVDTLLVCASLDAHEYSNRVTMGWLRRIAREGGRICGVGAGAYLLAKAGLLDGHPCSLHWQEHETFHDLFPEKTISPHIFELSEKRCTCAGGAATIDFMLHLIAEDHGRDFSGAIAEQFIQSGIRGDETNQRMRTRLRLGISDKRLIAAIELMEQNIACPLSIPELCKKSGISLRHCQRLFRETLHSTPQRYYLDMRLRFARQRLLHSSSSVLDVALSSGFVSASHFCRKYHSEMGHPPSAERHQQHGSLSYPS